MFKDRLDHVSDRCLAFRPGNSYGRQLFRRISEVSRGHLCQSLSRVVKTNHRHAVRNFHIPLYSDNFGTLFDYLPNKLMSVKGSPGNTDKNIALLHFS